MKGRSYHDKILNDIRRPPRKRGLKPWRGRGTFDKDQPMILCIHQRRRRRNKKFTYFDVPMQRSIINIIAKTIDSSSTVYTDEYAVYKKLPPSPMIKATLSANSLTTAIAINPNNSNMIYQGTEAYGAPLTAA
jgi:hypothetical protein